MSDTKGRWISEELTNSDIESACLSFRHDYGLMPESEQAKLRLDCRMWHEAVYRNATVAGRVECTICLGTGATDDRPPYPNDHGYPEQVPCEKCKGTGKTPLPKPVAEVSVDQIRMIVSSAMIDARQVQVFRGDESLGYEQLANIAKSSAKAIHTLLPPTGQVGDVPSVDDIYRWMLDTGSVQLKEMARSVHAELKALRQPVETAGEAFDGTTGHDPRCRSIPQVIRGVVQTGPCNCSLRSQPRAPVVEEPDPNDYEDEIWEEFAFLPIGEEKRLMTFSEFRKAVRAIHALLQSKGRR